MSNQPDVWLRGSVQGIDPYLQPAAHALLQVVEDLERACSKLDRSLLWATNGNAASIGFHLRHISGATDRLLTYAKGEQLSEQQIAVMKAEKDPGSTRPSLEDLLHNLRHTIDAALQQLRRTPPETLTDGREVGKNKLPSTVLGLLFHAAEHAQRHAGQIVTTIRLLAP